MIDREKIDELGYLNVQRNREGFLTNKFNKSKSTSTVDFCNNALLSFDRFVFSKFGKDSTEQIINDIKKLPESRHESVMIDMFQKYLHWKHEDSKASTSVGYYQTIVEYCSYHQLKINHYNLRREIILPQDPKNMKYAVTLAEIRVLNDNGVQVYSNEYDVTRDDFLSWKTNSGEKVTGYRMDITKYFASYNHDVYVDFTKKDGSTWNDLHDSFWSLN